MSAIRNWKELSRKVAFKKYSRQIDEVIFRLPDNSEADFYIKKEGPAAAVLALTKDKKVILVKQYRPGPKQILLELPGGYADDGESGLKLMQRELLEETGYKGKLSYVGECLDDAYSTMRRFCFVATDCRKVTEPQNSSTETTQVELLSLAKFRAHLRSGQLTDVEVGYLALDFLHLL